MKSSDQKHQGTCQDTEPLPDSTINRLPDEVLLEVFDSYRQSIDIDQYDSQWRKKYTWFNLALVCRRWRAVMFASSSRLDLNIVVGPEKPGHIKTILSGHLPILIEYLCKPSLSYEPLGDITGSALWRMRAALRHRDRVREISFGGWDAISTRKFISATNYHFPALESLNIRFSRQLPELEIPSTFLRGPDRSDLRLRRLRLYCVSVASVSGLLLSATALTDLTLRVTSAMASQGSLLLACLQGMQYLCSLDLTTPIERFRDSKSQHSVLPAPKDSVPLSKLTHFHYSGRTTFLNNLLSGFSAPSLQDAHFVLRIRSPIFYLSRVIDNVKEEFRSVSVTFDMYHFHLLSSTLSGKIEHFKPSFSFNINYSPHSINSMNSTPSTKLAMTEELTLNFSGSNLTNWVDDFSLREFLRQFRGVRVLRLNGFVREVGHYLQQDDGQPILPVLEEVELSILRLEGYSDEEYQRRVAEALAVFESCERAGHLVKVYHCERT